MLFYIVDVDDNLFFPQSFPTEELAQKEFESYDINLLSNDNPFSVWRDETVTEFKLIAYQGDFLSFVDDYI